MDKENRQQGGRVLVVYLLGSFLYHKCGENMFLRNGGEILQDSTALNPIRNIVGFADF
jgi:hypothetical protein